MSDNYDVLGVSIARGTVRVLERGKGEANADAIVSLAVMRRGVEEEFFVACPADAYHDGDAWKGLPT